MMSVFFFLSEFYGKVARKLRVFQIYFQTILIGIELLLKRSLFSAIKELQTPTSGCCLVGSMCVVKFLSVFCYSFFPLSKKSPMKISYTAAMIIIIIIIINQNSCAQKKSTISIFSHHRRLTLLLLHLTSPPKKKDIKTMLFFCFNSLDYKR
jgi:hypothetical protein